MGNRLGTGNIVEAKFGVAGDVGLGPEDDEITDKGAVDGGVAGVVYVRSLGPDAAGGDHGGKRTCGAGLWTGEKGEGEGVVG